ncbi:hypothetical protein KKH59_05840 [Patescibacteria group bacterium]|nr:hypothetical protein [Patescibacteria group bacterium]
MKNTKFLEKRDTNGFRPHKAQELREAIKDAKNSKKSFTSVDEFLDDLWQDAGAIDTLKELGPMSEEEYNYYMNLQNKE